MKPLSLQWIPTKLTSSPTSSYSNFNFFGVTFNRTLAISKHVSSPKAKLSLFSRPQAVSLLPHGALYLLYKSFLRPLLTYASPGWFPFLSVTNITKLERLHRAASRAITGFLSSEASLLYPLRVTLTHFTLSSYERTLCFPTSFYISGLD